MNELGQSSQAAPAISNHRTAWSLPVVSILVGGSLGLIYGATRSMALVTLAAGFVAGAAVGGVAGILVSALRRLREVPWWEPAVIYLVALGGLVAASGSRLKRPSVDNHFVYLADSLNHGQLRLRKHPPHQNDWARVMTLTLSSGKTLRGQWWKAAGQHAFRTTKGKIVHVMPGSVRRTETTWYVSFPPLPAMLMMPGVAADGYQFNDVWFTVIVAALNPVLAFLLLVELRRSGYNAMGIVDNLWLTAFFTFGTVHFYCAVIGEVWYTAHIVGTTLLLSYLLASVDGHEPFAAGLCLGAAFITRTPMLMAFPFFVLMVLKPSGLDPKQGFKDLFRKVAWRKTIHPLLSFALPVMVIGLWMAYLNWQRFDNPFEFGHTYLNIRWLPRIERWGLFNVHYMSRNLSAAFTLLPYIQTHYPYIVISRHGISLLAVTPFFVYAMWPKQKGPLHYACWLSIFPIALLHFMYQNSGYVQFTYRFSLDYTPLLLVLLTMTGRKFGPLAKSLILWGIVWHTFGALSFGRWSQFYAKGDWLFVAQ
ncbi:MAG: hypothetical protein J7M25_12690 [Deltaproteobacteria bacterium]|nr:hypothetical protein [Deltaproteobacteria bacterium]